MSEEASAAKTFRNRGYAWVCTVAWALFLVPSLLAATQPEEPGGGGFWLAWPVVVICIAAPIRAWQLRLEIKGGRLVRHSWFAVRSYDIRNVTRVRAVPYVGCWSNSPFGLAAMLRIERGDGFVDLPELTGRNASVECMAADVSHALGLVPDHIDPATGLARTPRHQSRGRGNV